jgi:hypothetical protein
MFNLIDKLQWGISKRATLEVFDGFEYAGPDQTQNAIGLFGGELFGYRAVAACYFNKKLLVKDSLARVNIVLAVEKTDDATAEDVFGSIQSEISDSVRRAGHDVDVPPDTPPELRVSRMCLWKQDDTVITLTLKLKRDGCDMDDPLITLSLGHATDDPISRQWE